MKQVITGIHHLTALAGDPQRNLDFYSGLLGLRFIKKTVNFDAPEVYHFYYGNETGAPGTVLTFFPYPGIRKGRLGTGMVAVLSFSVSSSALGFWQNRLRQYGVRHQPAKERFHQETVISLEDPDGLHLELVFHDQDARTGFTYGHIPQEYSVKGFYHAEIWANDAESTIRLLSEHMDHRIVATDGNRTRLAASGESGHCIDVLYMPDHISGLVGGGTVHHIAFASRDLRTQQEARERILQQQLDPTTVIDRQYFRSVYFREPGNVLFELATYGPGFDADESLAHLGETLKLPPQYEAHRYHIENQLAPVKLNIQEYAGSDG
jgi:glyoxalase family protein